jgi:uncharacterized small protein (DUF1192 family)
MATRPTPKIRTKRTPKQAARELADIILKDMADLPVAEQEARIDAFSRDVARLRAARAKSARPPRNAAKSR